MSSEASQRPPRRVSTTTAAMPITIAAALPHNPPGAGLLPGVGVATGGLLVTKAVGVAPDPGLRVGSGVALTDGLRVGSGVAVGGTCTG